MERWHATISKEKIVKTGQMDKLLSASPITLLCKSFGKAFTIFGWSFLTQQPMIIGNSPKLVSSTPKSWNSRAETGSMHHLQILKFPQRNCATLPKMVCFTLFKAKMTRNFFRKTRLKDWPVARSTGSYFPKSRFVIYGGGHWPVRAHLNFGDCYVGMTMPTGKPRACGDGGATLEYSLPRSIQPPTSRLPLLGSASHCFKLLSHSETSENKSDTIGPPDLGQVWLNSWNHWKASFWLNC